MLKVWPGLAPEQHFLLPLLSCEEPGGQVRMPLNVENADKSLFLVFRGKVNLSIAVN